MRFAGISSFKTTAEAEMRVRRDVRASAVVALLLALATRAMGF